MIFRPVLVDKILRLQKTQTRRPLKLYVEPESPWIITKAGQRRRRPVPSTIELEGARYLNPYRVGQVIPIQKGRGKPAVTHVAITAVDCERVGDITLQDARREGFRTTTEFRAYWARLYDQEWIRRELVDRASCFDARESVVDWILNARFEQRHADTLVWVVTFEPCERPARYMTRPTRTAGDYTTVKARSLTRGDDVDGAIVDDEFLERVVREARDREPARPVKRAPLPLPTDAELQALRDTLRVRYHGWEPEDVVADDPRMGTPGDVRAMRREMGLRGTDGLEPIPADERDRVLSFMVFREASIREIALAMDWSLGKTQRELGKRGRVEQLPGWLREKLDGETREAA